MIRKIMMISLALVLLGSLSAQDKPLERQANELGVQAETKYNEKAFVESGQLFEQAIEKYEEAVETDEEAVETDGIPMDESKKDRWLNLAFNAYFNGKDFDNAIRILEIRAERNPSDFQIVNYQSIIYSKYLNQPQKAIDVLVDFNQDNRSFNVESKIASAYLKQDNYEKALEWYTKAYELRQDSNVIQKIASLNLRLDRKEAAVMAYEDFLKTEPNESILIRTYRNMGSLYEDMNDLPNAIKYYEKSNELRYQASITLKLVSEYYELEQYDNALTKINQILANDPGNADAIYFRAMINYNRGAMAAARKDFVTISSNSKYSSTAQGFIESIDSE
ncbi:MAG: tetratricopeptide repeat protein [Candidatus Cloacimonadales bacterium]